MVSVLGDGILLKQGVKVKEHTARWAEIRDGGCIPAFQTGTSLPSRTFLFEPFFAAVSPVPINTRCCGWGGPLCRKWRARPNNSFTES